MTHVKFISTPESWSIKDFIDGLINSLKWSKKEVDSIKLIHTEALRNHRQHFRISFYDSQLIERLKHSGERTHDRNIRSIIINKSTVLMELKNNTHERFKLNDTRRIKSNVNHRTILVKFDRCENLLNIINKLSALNILKVDYLTLNKNNSFIRFNNDKDLEKFKHSMQIQKYRYKEADTFLTLIKSEGNNFDNSLVINDDQDSQRINSRKVVVSEKKIRVTSNNNEEASFDVVRPEDIRIKIDNMAEDLAAAVTMKFNNNNQLNPNMMQMHPYIHNHPNPMLMMNYQPYPYTQFPIYNPNFMQCYRPNMQQFGNYPHFY